MDDNTLPPPEYDAQADCPAIQKFGCILGSGDWDRPYKWLIEGLIPDNTVGFIGGPAASGKTFAAIEIMGAVISGRPAFGQFEVKRSGIVIYCAVEGRQGLAHRFEAYRQSRGIDEDQWLRLVQTEVMFRFVDTHSQEFINYIREIEDVLAGKVVLVIFDTLRTFGGIGDENGSTDAQNAINWMRHVAHKADCSTFAIHHSGKNADNPIRPGDDFNRVLRGSSDFGSSAECVIGVAMAESVDGEVMPWLWAAKLKDVKPSAAIPTPIVSFSLAIKDHNPLDMGVIACDIDFDIELAERVAKRKPGQPGKAADDARAIAEYVRSGTAPATRSDMRNFLHRKLREDGVENESTRNGRVRKALELLERDPGKFRVRWTDDDEQLFGL